MSASESSTSLLSSHLLACPRPTCEGDGVGTVRILVIPVPRDEKVARLLSQTGTHSDHPTCFGLQISAAQQIFGWLEAVSARTVILCATSGCCLFRIATTCALSAASVQRLWSSYTLDCGSPVPHINVSGLFNHIFRGSKGGKMSSGGSRNLDL